MINTIDIEDALSMPGVLGIYTGPDLTAAGIKPIPLGQATPHRVWRAIQQAKSAG